MVRRLLVVALFLLIASCGEPVAEGIRFGLAAAPTNLDPRYATDATSERINRLLYARLTDYDAQGRPVAQLASWQQLTPRHYRFTLTDPEHRFHNGGRLTSRDVAATYASILDPANASPHRGTLADG
jgi:peptide/nickel transport system substrate-binding protein